MKESKFIDQNKDKWGRFERLLGAEKKDPDKLSELFIQITDDLSYARTFYNNRSIRLYLNNICQQLFYTIYKSRKKRRVKSFMEFWRYDLPLIAYQSRKEMLTSLMVFLLAVGIGVISSANDPDFVRLIMGDAYVEMTVENINSGDPMAVYKKMNEMDMFLGITVNNLRVALLTFVMGVLWAVGSLIFILYNGIMIGAFQFFFIENGLFRESFLSIWLHGTLEISSIVIAGASGIVLGKGIIAPGSFSRLQSFQMAARRGAMLLLGIVPILIFAAIIESFLTRYTEAPDALRLTLILVSLAFIIFYFVIYPRKVAKTRTGQLESTYLQASPDLNISYAGQIKSGGGILKDSFILYRKYGNRIMRLNLLALLIYLPVMALVLLPRFNQLLMNWYLSWFDNVYLEFFDYDQFPVLLAVNAVFYPVYYFHLFRILLRDINASQPKPRLFRFLSLAIPSYVMLSLVNFMSVGLSLFSDFFLMPIMMLLLMTLLIEPEIKPQRAWVRMRKLLRNNYGFLLGLAAIILMITIVAFIFLGSPFALFYTEFLSWNLPVERAVSQRVMLILGAALLMFINLSLAPIYVMSFGLSYFTLKEINEADDLKAEVAKLGS